MWEVAAPISPMQITNEHASTNRAEPNTLAHPRLKDMVDPDNQPFDCKKMAYGGSKTLVRK